MSPTPFSMIHPGWTNLTCITNLAVSCTTTFPTVCMRVIGQFTKRIIPQPVQVESHSRNIVPLSNFHLKSFLWKDHCIQLSIRNNIWKHLCLQRSGCQLNSIQYRGVHQVDSTLLPTIVTVSLENSEPVQ